MGAGFTVAQIAAGVALAVTPLALPRAPLLVWNATASVPVGLDRIGPATGLQIGDLVLLRPPPDLAALWAERGYLAPGVPLLKPVAALPGSTVCRDDARIILDGRVVAAAPPADHQGRPLPVWAGCRRLGPDQLFLLNPAVPASLDGRYLGPSALGAILGKAVVLWTR